MTPPGTPPQRRAAIYVRISRDQTGEREAVDRQEEDCRSTAKRLGLVVHDVYADNDISARGNRKRPGFEALISAVRAGEVQMVIAWAVDRLTRNPRETLVLAETCSTYGVPLELCRGGPMDVGASFGELMFTQMAAYARYEIRSKSDRQRRAGLQRAEKGLPGGTPRPFGYELDRVTVKEDEARAIRAGYAAALSGGPIASIAREWNAAGFVTCYGNPFTVSSVKRVLVNSRYAGIRSYWGAEVSAATWAPIIDEATYRSAVTILNSPDRRTNRTTVRTHLLVGLALCGKCAENGVASTVRTHQRQTPKGMARTYRCCTTAHLSRLSEPVDAIVRQAVLDRLSRADAVELLIDRTRPDVDALRVEAEALRKAKKMIIGRIAKGLIEEEEADAALMEINDSMAATQENMSHADREPILREMAMADSTQVAEIWGSYSLDRKRSVIEALGTVTLHAGSGRIFRHESVVIDFA